ncbi:MAG: PQQ-binding-like beta-propeller repeat protein [Sedimentisphaerales bacterium]|nr:PQQ-binding-like beta-propeller repeat protein [Sedimentisphaerales bacterium]
MLNIFKRRVFLLLSLSALCFLQNSVAGDMSSTPLISTELLSHANLKVLWENELPIKDGESVKQLLILGTRVYVVSDKDYIISLNRENGKIVFAETFKPAGLLAGGFQLYGDELLYISGSRLVQIDVESGTKRSTLDLGFGATCPAARNDTFFYIAGTDHRLHVFRVEDRIQIFEATADNDSKITSVLADETFVIFATAAGNIICMNPNNATKQWQFDAFDAIAGPVIRDWASLFFASQDTNVYRVDMIGPPEKKRLVWKYQTEAELDQAPCVTQEVVYQTVRGKGVVAIDKEAGTLLWSVPGGVELLAEHRNRAYVMTKAGTLTVMDNVKAKRLYSVNFADVSRYAANAADEKIYVSDDRGRMVCLQPME